MPSGAREAQQLAERLLAGSGDRWRHVYGVAARIEAVAQHHPAGDTLLSAAWLHDIGYATDVVETGFHPLDGARYVANEGFPSEVARLVAYHSGADVEADERGLTKELHTIDPPEQSLLDILTLADMTTSPTGELVGIDERLGEILTRYDETDPVHRAVTRSEPLLRASARRAATALGIPSADAGASRPATDLHRHE